ncbi:MAG TPA: flagellar filament capping protein FliD, partial [Atopostipes sp.]|nr:flagellar filament capping protein FliD [Atopostipes sp.]
EVITVAEDRAKTTTAVKEFVEQYNSIMNFISTQMDVGDPTAEDNKTGALTGDGTVMRLQSGLRSIMSRNIKGDFSGDFKNLEDIGIEIDRYGVATLDEAALNKALEADATNVAKFFYSAETTAAKTGPNPDEVTAEAQDQEGISELLRNFIDTYISTSTTTPGVIKNKNETYDRMLKDINEQIETFNARIDRKRDRYIQQFTALDIAMMQAESQMDYLYSQIGLASPNQK